MYAFYVFQYWSYTLCKHILSNWTIQYYKVVILCHAKGWVRLPYNRSNRTLHENISVFVFAFQPGWPGGMTAFGAIPSHSGMLNVLLVPSG